MIIDTFPFFNELDLLEIRLNELKDVVDVFVLTEATLTHSGKPKPLYFDDNKERFSEFNIKHVIIDDYSGINISDPWAIEGYQRQCGVDYIKKMNPSATDVVLISDCDEIWQAERVKESATTEGWNCAGAYMPMFYYYMNCFYINSAWHPARWIKGDCLESEKLRWGETDADFGNTGWHFSYLGDIKLKLASFAHSEYDRPPYNTKEYIELKKSECKGLFDGDGEFCIVRNLSYLPKYVLKNIDRFAGYIK